MTQNIDERVELHEHTHAYTLLGILQSYAPNGPAQEKCTQFLHDMQRDNLSNRQQVKYLAGALHDGLTYGNWPWSDR